ncbi:MAG TPA: class I SAM-dependent methyltransferase [Miltoncostaeaceae bacterium]|nr:class I SAM-dependent methyltransferase [Miltoncostaeaceae bacterium]
MNPSAGHRVFAALYDRVGAPAERGWLGERRRALLALSRGDVLEVGAGTGANLAHLPPGLGRVTLSEPDPAMRRRLARRVARAGRAGVVIDPSPAERLALDDASVDTVVVTLALCSVASPTLALAEMRRVLRPDGRLLFLEHVRGHGLRARLQRLARPMWCRLAAGCHPDRDTVATIRAAGFVIERLTVTDAGPGVPLAKPYAYGVARRG